MDLSAVIFVVLALAWAVYLIPKALKHHDEMASDRLVEGHSERVRILRRKTSPAEQLVTEVTVETTQTTETTSVSVPVTPAASAARRRRRVLAVLLLAVAVVAGLAYAAIVPWWSTAMPGALVVAFLVVARLSVRRAPVRTAQRSSLARRRPAEAEEQMVFPRVSDEHRDEVVDLALEASAAEVDEPDLASQALADDGSLWDPLPMTLPTYVNKARARRTVRTIELTGLQSSGHDQDDSALAREADAAATEPGIDADGAKAAGA